MVTHYLRLVVYLSPLVFHYAWPKVTAVAAVIPEALLLLALIAATVWGLVVRHPLGFVGALFFGVLAPTSSIVPVVTQVAAEHRMYLPTAGVLVLLVAGMFAIARRVRADHERVGIIGTCALVFVATAVSGHRHTPATAIT